MVKQLVKNSVYNKIRRNYPDLTDEQFEIIKKEVDAQIREETEQRIKKYLSSCKFKSFSEEVADHD